MEANKEFKRPDRLKLTDAEIECVLCQVPKSPKKPWTPISILVAGFSGGFVVSTLGLALPFVAPALRRVCLPYIPATPLAIKNVMTALKSGNPPTATVRPTVVDIGSGDGRIMIEASKQGYRASGIEINRWLVWYSRYRAWRTGQRQTTTFHRQDLWKANYSQYDNIVIFGVPDLMTGIEEKLITEMKPDCKIIASRFPLPTLKPVQTVGSGIEEVWIYNKPETPL